MYVPSHTLYRKFVDDLLQNYPFFKTVTMKSICLSISCCNSHMYVWIFKNVRTSVWKNSTLKKMLSISIFTVKLYLTTNCGFFLFMFSSRQPLKYNLEYFLYNMCVLIIDLYTCTDLSQLHNKIASYYKIKFAYWLNMCIYWFWYFFKMKQNWNIT